jgi:hypothetical protein
MGNKSAGLLGMCLAQSRTPLTETHRSSKAQYSEYHIAVLAPNTCTAILFLPWFRVRVSIPFAVSTSSLSVTIKSICGKNSASYSDESSQCGGA